MVATVTGNGLGLAASSRSVLGGSGLVGAAGLGQGGEAVYVNAATGNLVIQHQDELLAGRGPDIGVVRTYNSRGGFDFDNNDAWQLSLYRKLAGLTGTVNTAGSSIVRYGTDGAQLTYSYDVASGNYLNRDGGGAFNTLRYVAASNLWTWTAGDTGATETYAAGPTAGEWRITASGDLDGNTLTYAYDAVSGLLNQVTDANGEATKLVYDTATKRLQRVDVVAGGVTTSRVYYTYDAAGRLEKVATDLTPGDGSIADGNVFSTTYTYDGASTRIASIANSDGTQVGFSYDGSGRVATVTDGAGKTTTYSYVNATTTSLTDPLGLVTTFTYDAAGQLTRLQGPVGSNEDIRYVYNGNGDLVQLTDSRGNVVTYDYNASGDLILQQDSAGNVVERSYNTANQLISQTAYAVPASGAVAASQPQTTYYVYDAKQHLRFSVTPQGRVTEYRYNAYGQQTAKLTYVGGTYAAGATAPLESALAGWVAAQDQRAIERADSAYDARGLVTTVTRFARTDAGGIGIADGSESTTRYSYDASGRLLQQIDPRGAVTGYGYDGLGRVVSVIGYDLGGGIGRQTTTTYNDAASQIQTTLANGLKRVATFDRRGLLASQVELSGASTLSATSYQYDADGRLRVTTDPNGNKTYFLYDSLGRKVGTVDATGALTETVYNNSGQVVRSVAYATASTASLASLFAADAEGTIPDVSLAAVRPVPSAADQVVRRIYDAAGQLRFVVDSLGALTENRYDGAGRLLSVTRYANALSSFASLDLLGREATVADVQIVATAPEGGVGVQIALLGDPASDRTVRHFYDADGLLRGTLDAEGFLTEYRYDAAGHSIQQTRYASATDSSQRAGGSFEELLVSANATPAADLSSRSYYNGLGQLVAAVDAEGYLTVCRYDSQGNCVQTTRYANRVVGTLVDAAAPQVLSALPGTVPTGGYVLADAANDQTSQTTWTAFNQVATKVAADGTVSRNAYDAVGNLVTTVVADGTTDAATAQTRYDLQGRVVQTLSPIGAAALAALGANPSAVQVDAVWSAYATTYNYDAAGRRIQSRDANGNVTFYYYDADNRLTFTVRRVADPANAGQWLGEVTERRYNALGQVTADVAYVNRLGSSVMALIVGGSDVYLQSARGTMATADDGLIAYGYDAAGRLATTAVALNATETLVTSRSYDVFGDLIAVQTTRDATHSTVDTLRYDRRGLVVADTRDTAGLKLVSTRSYDAFGRVVSSTDPRGITQTATYDKIGRTVLTVQASGSLNIARSTAYDAFNRVLSQTDGLGTVTTYAYDTANRTVTTTIDPTGLNIVTRTISDRRGQTLTIADAAGNETRFSYDVAGNLLRHARWEKSSNTETVVATSVYDAAGLLLLSTKDANGNAVTFGYDAAGRVLSRTVDQGGLNLTTRYAYDARGRTVTVTDPRGAVTQTSYDRAGRTLSVTVDPSGLALQTTYTYDLTGNQLTVTEGAGTTAPRVTRYDYDSQGRRIREIVDPTGLALTTTYSYDADNNMVAKVVAAGTAMARTTRYTYDAANRLVFSVDALGSVSRQDYDAEGRVVRTTAYAAAVNVANLGDGSTATVAALVTASSADRITSYAYDAAGRQRFVVDALGAVTEKLYDAVGNLVQTVRYAHALTGSLSAGAAPRIVSAPVVGIACVLADAAADRATAYRYDAFGRLVEQTEAAGTAIARTETWGYDAAGNVLRHTDGRGNAEWFAYDGANRQIAHIDTLGYVTRRTYEAGGALSAETRYMNAVALPTGTDDLWATHAPAPVPSADSVGGDRTTSYSYDTTGRLHRRTDASGVATEYGYDALGNVVDTTVAAGTGAAVILHRSYDLAGRVTSEIRAWGLPEASTTNYTYDAHGNQTSILTGVGTTGVRTTTQEFDVLGRKTGSIDGEGARTTTTYNTFGDIVKVVDARNGVGYFYADALGRVTLQVDPERAAIETRYDLLGNTTESIRYGARVVGTLSEGVRPQILDTAGSGTYVLANSAADQHQLALVDALGRKTEIRTWWGTGASDFYSERFTYDAADNVLTSTARNGATTRYEYDKANRKTRDILPITSRNASNAAVAVENRYAYDALGNLTRRIEAYGLPEQRTTAYEYDKLNREVRSTGDAMIVYDPVSGKESTIVPVQTKAFDIRGNLIEEVDARGGRTLHFYDSADRETGRVDAAGAYTIWTYDAVGNKLKQTAYANTVKVVGNGAIPTGSAPAVVATVPAAGAYVLVDAANDRTTGYLYDGLGRVVGTRVDGLITGYYDTVANIYRPTANTVILTQNVYDLAGNLVKSVDGNGGVTRSYYNLAGQRVAQLDAMGYLTLWARDVHGNVTKETKYANAVNSALTVDDATSLAQISANVVPDAVNDRVTELAYDHLNRAVLQTVYNVATGTVAANGSLSEATRNAVTRYTYDGLGNVTQKIDATGASTRWIYDAAGRKVEEQRPGYTDHLGNAVLPTTDYEYNGLSAVTRQLERGTNNALETDDRITSYTYGAGGFLTSQTDPVGVVTRFRVDASGNVTRKTLVGRSNADGVATDDVTTYRYDAMNRQVMTTDVGTGTTQESRYNAFGQVTGRRTNGGGTDVAWGEFADYDQAGRIWRGNSGDGITKVWLFDKAGNATLKVDSPTVDLGQMELAQIFALQSPVINQTVSIYDARNQLIDTIQPSMIGDGHQTIAIQQSLVEQQGTSFAGVGNVALTQAAGLGVVGAVTSPTTVGAVNISRAQTLSATMTDSYSYAYDSYAKGGMTGATHTFSFGVPDTSALGTGSIRVHLNVDAAQGMGGANQDFYVSSSASTASVSFSESASGELTVSRGYSYSLYKQTSGGDVLIGSYSGRLAAPGSQVPVMPASTDGIAQIAPQSPTVTLSSASSTTVMGNVAHFSGQRSDAARLILMARPVGSNAGWTVTNVPRMQAGGSPVAGWFSLDWSSWARGNYDFRYVTLDAANNVVNSEQGQMLLSNTAPTISQMPHTIGGAGRAFMDAAGNINFTEQGGTARTLVVQYRHAGSSEAWSSQVLGAASIGGAATPGWFALNTAGLSGRYEYTIEARNAAGVTLNKAGASFSVGDANSVLDPSGTSALTNATVSVGATAVSVTTVSGYHTDSYTYGSDAYTTWLASSSHAMTVSLPNTSAWGDGNVYVTTTMDAFSNGSGASSATYAASGQSSATMSFSESVSGYAVPPNRSYGYAIYKETANGRVYLGGSGSTTTNPAYSNVSQNLVAFNVQPSTASRLMMEYRKAGSNAGWSVMSVPPLMANGAPLPGRFAFDWSGWSRGAYEYRQVTLDGAGNVLSTGSGTMNLQDGAPSITKKEDLIGGAGRVFMDTAGRLNFTEQGSAATSMTIRYRTAGSSALWSARQVLAPTTLGGVATPGWFQFNPAAYGLSGNIEYVVEARNGSNQVLQKSAGTFIAGQASTVSDLKGYQEPAPLARFNQPVTAQTMAMSYRPAGSTGAFTNVNLTKSGTGVFDWDTGNVFSSDTATASYEYQYETKDANGVLVNKAHGVIKLGSTPSVVSHINDSLPTLLSFALPAGNATAATATQMVLKYRLTGSGAAFGSVALSRSDLAKPFVFDASALIPPGSLGSIDYSYTLKDATGATLLAADGGSLQVSGIIQVGTAPGAQALNSVIAGSTGPTVNLIHRRQSHDAFGQVVQEIDGRGNVTDIAYNTLGKVVLKQDPMTTVTLANGFQQRQRPTTAYTYDLLGNLIAVRDANGNMTTQILLPGGEDGQGGLTASEFHADGGSKKNGYDVFGNLRYTIDEIGRRTDYGYDMAGQMIRIDRPVEADGRRAWDTFAYDAAGNRIRHSTSPDGSAIYTDMTYYDSTGRVVRATTALGRSTTYNYVWSSDILGLSARRVGGWRKTTTDAMGRTDVDDADQFGRTTRHVDLGGHIFSYLYNADGWLINQSSSLGQNIGTEYYANGYVKRITDFALNTQTDYEYDDNGNRTYEGYRRTVGGATEYLQSASVTYDELNRVRQVIDTRADIRYEYDAMGNRRRVWSYYHDGIDGSAQTQDYWYAYDAMNRFGITMGKLSSADGHRGANASDTSVRIVAGATGSDGVEIFYDLAGQRRMAIVARDNHREDYTYSATGFLQDTYLNATGTASQGGLAAHRQNDLLGRLTSYAEYNSAGAQTLLRDSVYDADNRVLRQSGTDGTSNYAYYNSRNADGSDNTASASSSGVGELAKVESTSSGTTTTTWTTYQYWDGAKEIAKTIRGYNAVLEGNNGAWKPGMSKLAYNVNGHLASATDAGKDGIVGSSDDISFQYIDNAQGLTLRRDQVYGTGTGSIVGATHRYLYLDGRTVGDIGNDGDRRLDYAQTLAQTKLSKEERYKNWKPIASADFDQNYQPIGPSYPGATSSQYSVRSGDTLAGIAAAQWGDSSLWYLIADANGLTGSMALTPGQTLTIPNKVTNIHNNSSTFRPYEAGRVIGDTSPTLPDAPPAPSHGGGGGGGCGGLGAILVIIVIVVVTIYTAGAAAVAMSSSASAAAATVGAASTSTMAIGAAALGSSTALGIGAAVIGSAVGSIAGQLTGMALGIQDKFSWGAVATSALTAGATAGMGGGLFNTGNATANVVLNAAASNVVGQGISILTGQQKEFSWSSLAVSAIGAPISQSITKGLTSDGGLLAGVATDKFSAGLVSGAVSSLVSQTLRIAIHGGRLQWESIAGDALSSAIRASYEPDRTAAGEKAKEQPKDEMQREQAKARVGSLTDQEPTKAELGQSNAPKVPGAESLDQVLAGTPGASDSADPSFLDETLGVLRKGVQALTAGIIAAKELAFGLIKLPFDFVGGVAEAISNHSSGRVPVNPTTGETPSFFEDLIANPLSAMGRSLSNTMESAAFHFTHFDQEDGSFGASFARLTNALPVVGRFLNGGASATGNYGSPATTFFSAGINQMSGDIDTNIAAGAEIRADGARDSVTVPYEDGTFIDTLFGALNLNNGASAHFANQVAAYSERTGEKTFNLVGHSGGVQIVMGASSYLGDIGIAVDNLIGMQGPTLGGYNNARSISLMGNASFVVNGLKDFDIVSGLGGLGAGINYLLGASGNVKSNFSVPIPTGAPSHQSPNPNTKVAPQGDFWIRQANAVLNRKN